MRYLALLMLTSILLYSCQKDIEDSKSTSSYSHTVASDWVTFTLDMVKNTPGFSPPVAARTYGYLGLTIYEASRFGTPGSKSLAGQIEGLDANSIPQPLSAEYDWAIVTNAAASEIIQACFNDAKVGNEQKILDQYLSSNNQLKKGVDQDIVDRSISFGRQVGSAIVNYANSDGQIECYKLNFPSSYQVPTGLGYWKPTSAQLIPLQPYWGKVRSYSNGNPLIQVEAPLPYSTSTSSDFYKEAKEVSDIAKVVTEEQKIIANFWSDDPGKTATPPGHSMSIGKIVLEQENANLALAAELYAKLGMAVHDAFVSCWKVKYETNVLRPVTYINEIIDPAFKPILPTPPFPEYTSGHSVQSGAAAQILESMFGTSYSFTDVTHANRSDIDGRARKFSSFDAFAQEAALSRFYGGIHYKKAIFVGVSQGREIAKNISKFQFK